MDLNRLAELTQAWGADPSRWPRPADAAALEAIGDDPQARGCLDDAHALDRLLDLAPAQAPSLALRTRIAQAALARAGTPRRLGWLPALGFGVALAGAGAAGAVTGVAMVDHQIAPLRAVGPGDPVSEAARLIGDPADPSGG
jgi:hypothetical protein